MDWESVRERVSKFETSNDGRLKIPAGETISVAIVGGPWCYTGVFDGDLGVFVASEDEDAKGRDIVVRFSVFFDGAMAWMDVDRTTFRKLCDLWEKNEIDGRYVELRCKGGRGHRCEVFAGEPIDADTQSVINELKPFSWQTNGDGKPVEAV